MPPSEPVSTGRLCGITQMKLGFICPNLSGHVNPMTALARELQARNHDVVFLYSSSANGLSSVPGPAKDHIQEKVGQVSRLQVDDALNLASPHNPCADLEHTKLLTRNGECNPVASSCPIQRAARIKSNVSSGSR